jgi:hypothetical protein
MDEAAAIVDFAIPKQPGQLGQDVLSGGDFVAGSCFCCASAALRLTGSRESPCLRESSQQA